LVCKIRPEPEATLLMICFSSFVSGLCERTQPAARECEESSRCGLVENSVIPLYKSVLFMVYSPARLNARTDATTTIRLDAARNE
jgi:hypothetical protein